MTPTPELTVRLRKLINEVIPASGSEADTNFTDDELNALIAEAPNIYSAAAAGWIMKAGMLQAQIESYTIGQERYDLTSLRDMLSYALAMAQQYNEIAKVDGGSVILKVTPPEVL